MTQKAILITDPERFTRSKTGLVYPITQADTCLLGQRWLSAADHWQAGQQVESVNIAGRHSFATGEELLVKRVEGDTLAHVLILDIRMHHSEDLTTAEIKALGYGSAEDYQAAWGEVYQGRIWYIDIEHITASSETKEAMH